MADIGQVNMEEMVRKYGEEEVARLMNKIMENNVMMLKLQKQIIELWVMEEEKKKKGQENRKRQISGWRNVEKEMRRRKKKGKNREE